MFNPFFPFMPITPIPPVNFLDDSVFIFFIEMRSERLPQFVIRDYAFSCDFAGSRCAYYAP